MHATYKARVFKVEEKGFKSQIAHVCNCTEDDFDLKDWKTIQVIIINSLEPLSYSEMWKIKHSMKAPLQWPMPPLVRTPNWWPLKVEDTEAKPWQRCIAPPPDVVPPPPTPSAPRAHRAPRRPQAHARRTASSGPSTSSTKEYSVQLSSRNQHTTDSTSARNSKQDSGFVNDIFMSDASDDEFLNQL